MYALAEAGHQVSLVASRAMIPDHPNINVLGGRNETLTLRRIRMTVAKATSTLKFDAVHAVDAAAPFVLQICRMRKLKLIYDASRCFTGKFARPISKRWKWFPNHYASKERQLLRKADAVMVSQALLAGDLKSVCKGVEPVLIEDVPLQLLWPSMESGAVQLKQRLEDPVSCLVVCCVEALCHSGLRKTLMAARKVVDTLPGVSFVFRGVAAEVAEPMAVSLDIGKRCCFLNPDEVELYLSALAIAQAALFVPDAAKRYITPELLTLLNSQAPVVCVQSAATDGMLSESNSVSVLQHTDSMAEGLLHVLQEPLFSLGLSNEARQLMADRYSLSSFKHKLRMLYHETLNKI